MTYFIESAWGYCMVGRADIHNTPFRSSFLLIANFSWLIANSKDFIVAANSLAFDCQRVRYP